ncbi:hypothetical protein [Exiguobacterium sp. JLM-2]|uniref:hypothetical protein n=1 Tax=Exiguobacterium sp. JLM-2 TaxID=1647415 RepID=UPI000649CDC7|nr:hypothetical protein [Exiguobacterium sp. JLM-2]
MRILQSDNGNYLEHSVEVMVRKERFGVTREAIDARYMALELGKGATKKPTADTLERAEAKALSCGEDSDSVADYFALCRSFCEQFGAIELDS